MLTNENNIALISPRRLGKTDLIRHCFEQPEIKEHYYTFIIDIYATKNLEDFVNVLGKAILEDLRSKGRKAWKLFLNVALFHRQVPSSLPSRDFWRRISSHKIRTCIKSTTNSSNYGWSERCWMDAVKTCTPAPSVEARCAWRGNMSFGRKSIFLANFPSTICVLVHHRAWGKPKQYQWPW